MPTNISSITLNASIEKTWAVLTKAAYVKQWQFGSDLITSWKVGEPIRFKTEWQGKLFEQWGIVLEIIPNELIKYSLFAPRPGLDDKPENYFTMSYVLTGNEKQTQLKIIQEDNRPGAVQEKPQGEENPILKSLKTIAEAQ